MKKISANHIFILLTIFVFTACRKHKDGVEPAYQENLVIVKSNNTNHFFALDGQCGKLKWNIFANELAVNCKKLFFNNSGVHPIASYSDTINLFTTPDTIKTLSTVDAFNGKKVSSIKSHLQPSYMVVCCSNWQANKMLAVNSDAAIMWLSSSGTAPFKSILYATDLKTGSVKWKTNLQNSGPIRVAGNKIYIAASNSYVLNAETGSKVKDYSIPSINTPIQGTFYSTNYSSKMLAVDSETGAKKWEFTADKSISEDLIVGSNGIVFADNSGKLVALDAVKGTKKWEFELLRYNPSFASMVTGMAVADNTLYAATPNYVYALDANTGHQKWKVLLENSDLSHWGLTWLQVKKNAVYIAKDNAVTALKSSNGEKIWKYEFPAQPEAGPIALDELHVFDKTQLDF